MVAQQTLTLYVWVRILVPLPKKKRPSKASVIPVEQVETDASFRDMCAANACGNYGRNWMCPPDAGDIHDLMARLQTYSHVLVYQTVTELWHSRGEARGGGCVLV